jgi:Uma2 family endonuclease
MASQPLVSIDEYLSTSYDPDCEYVDGVVMERNWGEMDHGLLHGALPAMLFNRRREWGIHVYLSLRTRVASTRIRVPDACVIAGPAPKEQILSTPPLVCIEILSPEDRWLNMLEKIDDYLRFGVKYVWLIHPRAPRAWECTSHGMREVTELRTEQPPIRVPLADLFAELQ